MTQGQIQLRPVKLEIVIKDSIADLEAEVSKRLATGQWMPHGDWVILQSKDKIHYDPKTQYAQGMFLMDWVLIQMPESLNMGGGSGLLVPVGAGPSPLIR